MIDYLKVQQFLVDSDLLWEELGILYTIYSKKQNKEYATLAKKYYSKEFYSLERKKQIPLNWVSIVENLIDKGFIEDFRTEEEKADTDKIQITKLSITDKFVKLLVMDKDTAYKEALACYPDTGIIDKNGVQTKYFTKLGANNQDLKDFFYKEILKGGNLLLLNRFKFITLEIHDGYQKIDNNTKEVKYEFSIMATMGWKKYLESFDEVIAKDFESQAVSTNSNLI